MNPVIGPRPMSVGEVAQILADDAPSSGPVEFWDILYLIACIREQSRAAGAARQQAVEPRGPTDA